LPSLADQPTPWLADKAVNLLGSIPKSMSEFS
jgi:hypothetical protein